MPDSIEVTVRKNRTTNAAAISGTLSITCFIAWIISVFSTGKSPLQETEPYLLLFGFLFSGLVLYVFFGGGAKLMLEKNPSGYTSITVLKGNRIEFEYAAQLKTRAAVMRVPTGGRGTMPELYLVFSDPQDKPILTLKYNPGKLGVIPTDFEPVEMGTLVASNIYTCRKIREVYETVKLW
jgi:hypothetical protein